MRQTVQVLKGSIAKMVALQHQISGRDRILVAARDLFASKGFHQTSMAELASAAQVSVGQIYRLFKGKEDVIEAIVRVDSSQKSDEMAALRESLRKGELDIEQTFERLMLIALNQKDEALSFDILAEAFRNRDVGDMIAAMCQTYRGFLRDFACEANPDLSGEALDGAEEMILACHFGLGHRSVSRPNLCVERTAKQTGRMMVASLKAIG